MCSLVRNVCWVAILYGHGFQHLLFYYIYNYYKAITEFFFMSQMVSLLLEKGATINAYDKKDRRAVHWAAYMGHVEVVKLLVDHGAELNCRDKMVIRHYGYINYC